MKKLISYSIWGDNPLYCDGIVENAKQVEKIYPGWTMRVYHDNRVPQTTLSALLNLGVENVFVEKSRGIWDGLFWRFYPASEPSVDIFIVRDADSRLTCREKVAVDDWLKSASQFHTMRDHWNHNVPIMGGMWGCRKDTFPQMIDAISKWRDFDNKGTDQIFLQECVWKHVQGSKRIISHDRYPNGFFKLPDGKILYQEDVSYLNMDDNCGMEKNADYPRGKIEFKNGSVYQRLDVYHYEPRLLFGPHDVRPFPNHGPMEAGTYVGESTLDYGKNDT